ncbi:MULTISPECIES: cation diffusion facilitator family transporter [unclassified Nitratiruptor]|uniref:cation diffusion facilitator family transporter n=1 Tax=unclassified Nitratiruptor TaxID=2624044 RepID=UPI00191523F4|nr:MULTISPECIES: cation diffusion facilitator family transporter [unclassified Nitratiruptor]BCD59362.1 cobalt-zinc-cadmium efflux system protein [Nitratiruptor sp. YY08-10]BCD63286.1 cobalt-zinc-cadmium efflux system protein [Nitratiruptor sp. YY08-14]
MGHHHHHEVSGKNLFITIILNIIITLAQIIGGFLSGSLALLSDAMHNFSDVLSLVVAWIANRLAARPGDSSKTFGYKRAEIIAALFNASLLMAIAIFLIIEAVRKFLHPEAVDSMWVIWLGVLSIVLNSLSVFLVKEDAHENMNIKAAYLHLLTDVATSVAVVVGGLLMQWWHIYWIDPVISIFIAFYLIWASFDIIKESVFILMQFAPKEIDLQKIAEDVSQIAGIENIHHIHIWRLNDHDLFFEAHVDFSSDLKLKEVMKKMEKIEKVLKEKYHISHVTLQPEYRRNDTKELVVSP